MSQKGNGWTAAILAILGITATGLYFRVYAFLWRAWVVLSVLWISFWLLLTAVAKEQVSDAIFIFTFAPPLLLLVVGLLLAWVMNALLTERE